MIGKPGLPWLSGAGTGGESKQENTRGRESLEQSIVRLLGRREAPMSALEIAQHVTDTDRSEVKSLLEGPLNEVVESEGVTPPRWTLIRSRGKSTASDQDAEAMGFWDRRVLDVLEKSPFRLTAREIAKKISKETDLETDRTAVEALLNGSLNDCVQRHGDSPVRWSAAQSSEEGESR